MPALISERELAFLLYEFLDTEELLARPRYADHSKHGFDEALGIARRLASELFAPHNARGDASEPVFRDGTAHVIDEARRAWKAFGDAGFLSAHWDVEEGGLQLPEVVFRAAMSLFFCANVATAGYPFLTIGAANLLRSFGTPAQKAAHLANLGSGHSAGTMALTEPGQGSSLADIRTTAILQSDGTYRLFGQKIFISGGDQNITDNIVHMVLARIQGAPAGARGISLFLVPKVMPDGQRNDVALAGLLHKMGWHGTTSTLLSFGERDGAVGELLGEAGRGLFHMFQMMNEARIGVGTIAACLAWSGFAESLTYARERSQGRLPSAKDPFSPQVRLVEHADVRRLLLAQKAFAEGSLALCLFASSLFEDQHTHADQEQRRSALLLLDVLTPVVKSWPSKYGCASNDMAMQVLGGAGYTREHPLEQLYRDQRLNPIHEGAEAIHGIDLLGRKVVMEGGAAFEIFRAAIDQEVRLALCEESLAEFAQSLHAALSRLAKTTTILIAAQAEAIDLALANATVYLDCFGRVAVGWMWLRQARVIQARLNAGVSSPDANFYRGKLQACAYYFRWELTALARQCELLESFDRAPFDMKEEWFQ